MKKYFASSELIINEDGSVFHLHVKPEWLADKVHISRIKNVKWRAANSKQLQVLIKVNESPLFPLVSVAITLILL